MKVNKKVIFLVAAFFILLVLLIIQSFSLYSDRSKLKGQNELLRIQNATVEIEKQQIREEKDAEIGTLKGEIRELNTVIAENESEMGEKDERLRELESELPGLEDKDKIIFNLTAQNNLLREKFSLASAEIDALKAKALKWELAYNAQVEISESWQKQYESEKALRLNTERLLKKTETRLKLSRLNSKLSKVGAGILAGVLIYKVVKD